MKIVTLLICFWILFFNGCIHLHDSGEIDLSILPELESIQNIMAQNNALLFKKSKDPLYIASKTSASYAFRFLDSTSRKKICDLFELKKVALIIYHDSNDLMIVKLKPLKSANILVKSSDEVYIVYENNDKCKDCKGRKRVHLPLNEEDIVDDKIVMLKKDWYKIIVTYRRRFIH